MLWKKAARQIVMVTFSLGVFEAPAAHAEQLNAGAILNNMNGEERFTYLAGVVEGLAYAGLGAGETNEDRMACLFSWFYDHHANRRKLEAALAKYPDEYAAPIILVLTKRTCGVQ